MCKPTSTSLKTKQESVVEKKEVNEEVSKSSRVDVWLLLEEEV